MFDPHASAGSYRGGGNSASILAPRPVLSSTPSSSSPYPPTMTSSYYSMRCTDVPQFTELQMSASRFRSDPKLHLKNLLADAFRCDGLMAVHKTSRAFENGGSGREGTATTKATTARQTSEASTSASDADVTMRRWNTANNGRRIILDYSRQHVTGETMEVLFDLADRMGLTERMNDMRNGTIVNVTERRGAMHHVLRMPRGYNYGLRHPKGNAILGEVHDALGRIETYSNDVRDGSILGCTGRPLKNVVCICVGGSHTGTEAVYEALRGDAAAASARSPGSSVRFVADVDPVDFDLNVRGLDPEETLFVVASKSFASPDTMHNACEARRWLVSALCGLPPSSSTTTTSNEDDGDSSGDDSFARDDYDDDDDGDDGDDDDGRITEYDAVSCHFCGITSSPDEAAKFGIAKDRIFPLWNWSGGRFSVWSPAGMLPLSVHYSYDVARRLLDGAHDIDEHFFDAPRGGNIPVLLGLLGIWNSTFMGYHARCILPYSRSLRMFPSVVQKFDMESNGKGVTASGANLTFHAGEIDFGESGSVGLHSFYQLLHQGRPVPADFVGFMESQSANDEVDNNLQAGGGVDGNNTDGWDAESGVSGHDELDNNLQAGGGMDGNNSNNTDGWDAESGVSGHDELMSNFFAQPDALAIGKTLNDLIQEGVEGELM